MKVFERTRTQVQYASGVLRKTQAEILEAAVDEYIERHAEDITLGIKHAREALLAGRAETVAYLLDEDVEAVRRVSGSAAPTPPAGTDARPRTAEVSE
jgi:hypothetical protein